MIAVKAKEGCRSAMYCMWCCQMLVALFDYFFANPIYLVSIKTVYPCIIMNYTIHVSDILKYVVIMNCIVHVL